MELRQLQTFREVARTLSFTRTANTLNYAQSSVSAQIQALEEELNVTLFDRLGRRIVLTDAGQRLIPYVDKILALADEAQKVVTGDTEPTGVLTIGAPETICAYRLPTVVEAYRRCYPNVDIIFRPDLNSADWDGMLREGTVDAVLIVEGERHRWAETACVRHFESVLSVRVESFVPHLERSAVQRRNL